MTMKRCVVITRFARSQPGYLDFAYRIEALSKHYAVSLVTHHPLNVPEMAIADVEHVVLPGGESVWEWLRYLWNSARFIRERRPDCVILLHTNTAPLVYLLRDTPHALYWNEHALRVKGAGAASTLKRIYRDWKYRYLFIRAAQKADLVMPIGEAHYDDLLAQGCMPERMKLIHMGVDESFTGVALERTRPDKDAPLELIYTGSVQKERGRDVMLEATAKAVKSGVPVRLTFVGAIPEEMDYCNAYACKLGIEHVVNIHGRVPGKDIPRFIAQADAGICIWEDLPWWRFNPPTKLFEYLVAGLPVLASNIRTHTAYIRHWDNGIIFEYDSDSLAQAIRDLWQRRSDLNDLKRRAHESGRPYLWNNIEPVFLESVASLVRR